MKSKQSLSLFFCNFAVFFVGGALLPLLPLYATDLGASSTLAGIYLGTIYLAIATGTMLTGRLAERWPAKSLFIGAGLAGLPALILHTYITAMWQLIILTSIVWFCGGIGTALVSVLTGLHADHKRRGKSFGLMFLARPLAGMLGGLVAGQIVAWQGYPLLFAGLSLIWAGWPLLGLLGLENHTGAAIRRSTTVTTGLTHRPAGAFYLLIVAALLSTVTVYVGRLGISLSMQTLNFSPGAVTLPSAVGWFVSIPITLLIGVWSDRLGRRTLLVLSYLLTAGGALLLGNATGLWQFCLAAILLLLSTSANGSVAAAFATDLLDAETLQRGLPWLNTMTWAGGVLGFAGAGYVMDTFGATTLYLLGAGLALLAAGLTSLNSGQLKIIWPWPLRWIAARAGSYLG